MCMSLCRHHHRTSQQPAGQGYPVQGGLFAEEAIKLLQDFYLAGNPKGQCRCNEWAACVSVG